MTDYSKMTPEQLVEEREKRDKARSQKNAERSRLLMELELKFEDELGGPKGVAFAIYDTPETPIVIKLGAAILYKRWQSAKREKETGLPSLEVTEQFVQPNIVYPDLPAYEALVDKRKAVAMMCANLLAALYQGDQEAASGKF